MINKVTLIGNLGKDPEVRRLESGVAVAKIAVATTESYKDKAGNWQDQTEWHNVVLWRNMAERVESQLKKGMMVYIEGKLTTRKWQDKEGNDRYTTEVVASYFRNLGRRQNSEQGGSGGSFPTSSDAPATSSPAMAAAPAAKPAIDTSAQEDDDLPF